MCMNTSHTREASHGCEHVHESLQALISRGTVEGMFPLTQSISASKGHFANIALVGFLSRMSTFMNGKFGILSEPFTTVSAKE